MALLRNFKQNKEVSEGTFNWEIDNSLLLRDLYSPFFKFNEADDCNLAIELFTCNLTNNSNYLFYLEIHNSADHFILGKFTSYKICLFSARRQTFVSGTGIVLNKSIMLPIIVKRDDMRTLLSLGNITLSLSWHPWKQSCLIEEGTQTSKVISVADPVPISLLEKLSDDLKCFYDSKIDTDCVMRVSDVQFPAHKAVLSAHSSVFAAMFHNETPEKSTGVVDILDVDSVILSDVLKYMYSGKIHGMNTETAALMYEFADKYAILGLRDHSLCFLKNNLTIDNVCYAAILAHTHGETELEEKVSHFIEDRLEDVLPSSSWKYFASTKPSIAMKYLSSSFVACKKNKEKKDDLK